MRIDAIDIEAHAVDKIETKHGVTFDECEEAALSRHRRIRRVMSELYKVFGRTDSGRYLLVVLVEEDDGDTWWVVTARDMTTSERRNYDRSSGR